MKDTGDYMENTNELILIVEIFKNEFHNKKINIDYILKIIEESKFKLTSIEFIYNCDLILSLELKDNFNDEFYAEIRFVSHEDRITNVYFYRI